MDNLQSIQAHKDKTVCNVKLHILTVFSGKVTFRNRRLERCGQMNLFEISTLF